MHVYVVQICTMQYVWSLKGSENLQCCGRFGRERFRLDTVIMLLVMIMLITLLEKAD